MDLCFPAVSQIGTLETLIGSRVLYSDHVLLRFFQWELMEKYEIMVFACQVSPFHLMLTRVMNCIAKNKCRGENLNATSRVSRAATCIFFACFVFDLFYARQEKRQKILLSF